MLRHLVLLLVVAAPPLLFAQGQTKKPVPPPVLSLHGLKKAISHFWDGKRGLLCADCIQLAMQIDHLLYKPADVASDDPNIGAPGPGRRMKLGHRESEILAALDGACSQLGGSRGWQADVLRDCQRLIAEHRRALESVIFDKGTAGLTGYMCVDELKLCDTHHVVDSGEL